MDLQEYLTALRTRWVAIVILAGLGGAFGFAYSESLPDQYRATSSVFLSAGEGTTTSELVQGSTFTQSLVQSYASLATQPIVLSPVIQELGLNETPAALASSITADAPLNTVLIEISATETSATDAAAIANAVTSSLARAAKTTSPVASNGKPSITMTLVARAEVPATPVAPNKRLLIITGAIVGLIVGIVFALGRALLDTRIRGERDVKRAAAATLIGSVPRRHRTEAHGLAMLAAPHGSAADSYRRIRANLEFADVDHGISALMVTSALPGEGKTTTTINLALAIAERERRVLVIDADLHRPALADYCGLEGAVGLTTILIGDADAHTAIRNWTDGVDILPSGVCPANPNQVLSSHAMAKLIADLKKEYDVIIIDTPPLLPTSDALTVAHLTDAVLLVALYNSTRRGQLQRAYSALVDVKASVIGVVLNNSPRTRSETYHYTKDTQPKRRGWRRRNERSTAVPSAPGAAAGDTEGDRSEPAASAAAAGRGASPEHSDRNRLRAVVVEEPTTAHDAESDEATEGYARASRNG